MLSFRKQAPFEKGIMEKIDPAAFEFATRIRYSEIAHDGLMTLPALIDLFQDCSIFHSEEIGFGPERLKRERKAWVLTHWHLVIDRYPRLGEQVTAGTFASGFKTVSATRNFYLRDAAGSLVARAHSTWGFIDLAAGKPVRPSAEHVAAYQIGTPLEMPEESRKIALPNEFEACKPFAVRRDLIDTNEHVNNSQYVRIALGALPCELRPRQARVDYRRSAVMGDIIQPRIAQEADRTVVVLAEADGVPYGVVELR